MRTILLAMLTLALAGCGDTNEPRPLVVFAAASTTDVMTQLIEAYGEPADCSFASSSMLARQIEAGAPADVYLSANAAWMDHLAERGLIDPSTRRDAAANQLVVIVPTGGSASLDADFAGRLALGDPQHVPAGIYARQALERMNLWPSLQSRVVAAIDARAALRYVETGEAQLGIVYAGDAQASSRVTIIERIDPAMHDPIRYPVAAIKGGNVRAERFIAYLVSEDAAEIWRAAGFEAISNKQ
jgi:molybdate transport system substrate-binding protein